MPCVEGTFSGIELTETLVTTLETEITATLRDTIADSFAVGLGYQSGTPGYEQVFKYVQKIMPGWTWLSFQQGSWAIRNAHIDPNEAVVAHIRIFVLAEALTKPYRQKVAADVFATVKNILSSSDKKVHIFVDIIEGEVDLTLPQDLFGTLLQGSDHKLLKVPEVVEFIKKDIEEKGFAHPFFYSSWLLDNHS